MAWLKARLLSFYQGLPAGGYGFAIVPAWLFGLVSSQRHGFPGPALEWLAFVLAPAIAGALHVIAPRASRGGRWYWILAGAWFGAAVTSVLAHWRALDPYTPWFSLTRYVLIAAGVLLFYLSHALGRWCFGRPVRIGRSLRLWKTVAYGYLVFVTLIIAYSFYITPFRQALAPRLRMVSAKRIYTLPRYAQLVTVAWSPDERRVAIQGEEGVSVVEVATGRTTPVATNGAISNDHPWLSDGTGFLMLRREEDASSIWHVSPDGREQRLLRRGPHVGPPTCSPDGTRIAFSEDHALWIGAADGTGARRLVAGGRSPRWSPDGKRLLFIGVARGKDGKWRKMDPPWRIAGLDGQVHPLRVTGSEMSAVAWLDDDSLISIGDREGHRPLDPFDLAVTTLHVWGTNGQPRRSFDCHDLFGIYPDAPSVAPDHRTVAVPNSMVLAPSAARPAFYLLDTDSGRLGAVPVGLRLGGFVSDVAWSRDGRKLLFTGSDYLTDEFGNSESQDYLGLIEGL
jgi:hypothetical protein